MWASVQLALCYCELEIRSGEEKTMNHTFYLIPYKKEIRLGLYDTFPQK